jgi:hypothetical protein
MLCEIINGVLCVTSYGPAGDGDPSETSSPSTIASANALRNEQSVSKKRTRAARSPAGARVVQPSRVNRRRDDRARTPREHRETNNERQRAARSHAQAPAT